MPNTGKPSRGCHACRASKVKCDEISPSCGRCTRLNRLFPGYRDETDLNFRDMNLHAQVRVQSRVRDRKKRREGKSASRGPAAERSDFEASPGPSTSRVAMRFKSDDSVWPIVSSINIDWEAEAAQVFFSDYIIYSHNYSNDPGLVGGYLEFLPELCLEQADCPCLMNALLAVSCAHLASQSSMKWLSIKARKSYGKALSLLNGVLQKPDQAQKDSTLATVVLLSMYELISGDKPNTTMWDSHESGRALLLRIRGLDQFQSLRGQSLFRVVHTHMQWSYLFKSQQPPDETTIWLEAMSRSLPSRVIQLLMLTYKTSQIRATADKLMIDIRPANEGNLRQSLDILLQEASSLDLEYQKWSDSASNVYQYKRVETSNAADQDLFMPYHTRPREIFVYQDLWVAGQWHKYYVARIHLLQMMLECQFHMNSIPTLGKQVASEHIATSEVLTEKIFEMVDGICAGIPYMMGEVDSNGHLKLKPSGRLAVGGMSLLMPLQVASRTKVIGREQKMWIKDQLRQIGYVTGINQAHVLAARPIE